MVGGLIFSQFVTLFLTPVFYIYMERVSGWLGKLSGKKSVAQDLAPTPGHGPSHGGPVGAPMARSGGATLPESKNRDS